mmetsp:Transcript_7748/g.10130  ORF Transcript_7748/g.10130 Transcript_7748/m.10130 type:complete len:188 (+) Transcript_7748:196-759(+)
MPLLSVHKVTPLEPGCPWAEWTRPNIKWCEENLCSYITTPANTWSNLSYIVFGIWMIYDASKRKSQGGKKEGSRTLTTIGFASIMVGVTSLIYHASYTAQGQFLDFVGMYMFAVIPVILNLRRLRFLTKKNGKYCRVCNCVATFCIHSFSAVKDYIPRGISNPKLGCYYGGGNGDSGDCTLEKRRDC